jgi:hypothetical protein
MKKMNFEQMEQIQGGSEDWCWSAGDHIACAIVGAIVGGGIGSVAAYGTCLWFTRCW